MYYMYYNGMRNPFNASPTDVWDYGFYDVCHIWDLAMLGGCQELRTQIGSADWFVALMEVRREICLWSRIFIKHFDTF